MRTLESTVLLISQDEALCSAMRRTLEHGESSSQLASVASFVEARDIVADLSPDLIVLQESAIRAAPGTLPGAQPLPLADIVTALAGFAPVIIFGKDGPPAGLAALIAAGAADFISADELHFSDMAACVEKHLRSARRPAHQFNAPRVLHHAFTEDNFGEILRHELNNPLTGILGNAELLLAEMRRQNIAPLSEPGVKRLETIAALAVRMRETVRRLSQACESRAEHVRSA